MNNLAVLIETRLNALKLTESKNPPRKGCLGRMEGVCADFKNPTRNGRLYSRKLWDKVFNDSLFQEALQSKTLIGELDHPEDRFEPLAKYACVVMTDYRIDENAGLIYAGFDILDTPQGQILKSLLDYGCVMGVSSRGQGDIVESADGEMVEEDSYDFACFDVVTTPAVEKARQKVTESMKLNKTKSFKESVKKQIEDASSITDLNIIRSVVKTSDLSKVDMDTFMESIEHKCNSLSEGKTISSDEDELQNAYLKIAELKEQLNNSSSTKTIRENKELYSCINELRKQVSAYKHREKRFVESVTSRDKEVSRLKEIAQKNDFEKSKKSSALRTVTEKYNSVQDQYNEVKKSSIMLTNQNGILKEQLQTSKTENMDLKKQLISCKKDLSVLQNDSRRMTEQLQRSHQQEVSNIDGEVKDYTNLLDEATNKINSYEQRLQSLTEKCRKVETLNSGLKENSNKLSNRLMELQKSFLKESSKTYGVDPSSVEQKVTADMKSSDIINILKEEQRKKDRYLKMPISNPLEIGTKIISENLKPKTNEVDEELENLSQFVETVTNSL